MSRLSHDRGGEATSQGTRLRWDVPTEHACSLITHVVQMLQEPWTAEGLLSGNTRKHVSVQVCGAVKVHRFQDLSVKCAHVLHWSHIPRQARPSRCSPLAWGTSVMTSACFVPRFGREIKILLGKEKQTSKFCWPNWACGKAAKNKRENSKSTKNPSLERKRKGSGLTDTFPRMTNF